MLLSTMQYEVNTDGSGSDLDEDDVMAALSASLETWDYLGSSGIIAANYFWFNPATKEMIESDVRFNTYYAWSVADTCSGNMMDLQNIATHEFGHAGLNDLYLSKTAELTMYGYSSDGETKKRTLGTGDISGIQALYG